jgi:hypothetical protein
MAHTLKPFRSYDEHDVVNLFAFDGAQEANGFIAAAGTVVKVAGDGFQASTDVNFTPTDMIGSIGSSYTNVVSQRFALKAKVSAASSGQAAIGITLMGVQENDENGVSLAFNPRKAQEKGVVISGQGVPVLTRGIVLYSGSLINDSFSAGAGVYLSATPGELSTTAGNQTRVGTLLGKPINGTALIKLNF